MRNDLCLCDRSVPCLIGSGPRDRPKHGGATVAARKTRGGNEMAGDDRTERRRWNEADPRSCPRWLRRSLFDSRYARLTLDDGKALLAGVQRHLVQARVAEYCALRRRCSHCRGLRLLKDTRTRRLNSLFGTVEVPAPRFKPCRCAVRARSTLCPASELMPDRCTPEYDRSKLRYESCKTACKTFQIPGVNSVQ